MLSWWHRRYWTPDVAALERAAGLVPFVVVTGGSDGIGFAIARRFVRDGRAVLLVARRAERLSEAQNELRASSASRVGVLALDVTAANAAADIEAAVERLGGYVDVLVNSAGVGLSGAFGLHDDADLQRLIDLNVRALAMLCRRVLPGMRARGRGGIINVASLGGYAPGPYQAAYYASKAFVISLTEAIAFENRGQGLSITAVAPGPVETAFHRRMRAENGWYLKLVPMTSADIVARETVLGFKLSQRVVLPGLVNKLMLPFVKVIPHRLLEPLLAALLDPRGTVRPK